MKQTKKGFTLVELLVVIAILAILATVSVVGYTAFIQKAHQSNDRTLVAQLNKLIIRVDGEKYGNFHEVVETLQENGIDVTKLSATAKDYDILWDMDAQEFYYTADEVRNGLNIWIVSETLDTAYSTYYVGDATTIETTLGFDAGTSAVDVVFKGSDAVIIRTNGGNLTVESGSVTHYGQARYLSVAESATYTEKGTIVANVAEVDKITDAEITADGWTKVETEDQLKQALADKKAKIVLGADIEINDEMTADTLDLFIVTSDVEINLNGHNIVARRQVASTFKAQNNSLISVKNASTLTLSGYGILSLELEGNNFGWNAYSATIALLQSTGIVNDAVVVEHLGGTDMAYAIDVNSGTLGANLQVNGGLITSANYRAIRAFCNSTNSSANITINDGHVYSPNNSAIWMQNPMGKGQQGKGNVSVVGGIVESAGYANGTDRKPLVTDDSTNISATVTNGQLIQNGVDVTAQYK